MKIPWIAVTIAALLTAPAAADQVVPDDQIVHGSLCVGPACAVDENFGFDTVRLRGDELRIHFDDTSSSGAFPRNDWRITINDDDLGTRDRFSIDDATGGTTPLTVEAGAPTNSLYLSGNGSVGIGTGSPVASAALDVRGSVRVDEIEDLTGDITTGAKAGIIPGGAFVKGEASVVFATPYAGDFTVLLTPFTRKPKSSFRPTVTARHPGGFTISTGKKNTKDLVEMHWMTQPVSE